MPRSYLYVPGDQPRKLAGARRFGADAVIADLEDSVLAQAKATARREVARSLAELPKNAQWWVRVSPSSLEADLEAVVCDRLSGIVLAKAEPDALDQAAMLLGSLEERRGLAHPIPVLALLESARGIVSVMELASHVRVVRLGLGEADLAADLGLRPGPLKEELWPIRLQVVLASAVSSIAAPVGPTQTALGDDRSLEESTALLLRQGFRARTAIHPGQVGIINAAFTPTEAEITAAQDVVDALREAGARGEGVATTSSGLVDAAVARAAEEVLARGRHRDSSSSREAP
jgi:citrate lyase subunit beta/citryl-CoA lyase